MSPFTRSGLYAAFGAYLIWGVLPLFLKGLQAFGVTDALEIVAHRVLWALPFVGVYLWRTGKFAKVAAAFRAPKLLLGLAVSAALIGINWGVYTWAVGQGRILEASLGYYINPLVNVALGTLLLREKMRPLQWLGFGLAALGVLNQTLAHGALPWISLVMCFSFAAYGLVKKKLAFDASAGFFVEAAILSPLALVFLIGLAERHAAHFGAGAAESVLLVLTGPVTATPLILFAVAAQRLRLTTLGFIQYSSPSLQLLIAVALGERFTHAYAVTFALIWMGLAVYSFDALWAERRRRAAAG